MTVSADQVSHSPSPSEPAAAPEAPRPASWPGRGQVPQVNLLPPEILASRRFRGLQIRLAAVALGVVALCGVGVWWTQQGVDQARQDLEAIQAQGVDLQGQQTKYVGVPKVLSELDEVKAAREGALGADVAWYRFLSDLAVNTPSGTQLSTVTISMGGAGAMTTATPLSTAGLGTVTVTGYALKFRDVAEWLDAVNQVHGLAGSGFETAAKEDPTGGAGGASGSGAAGSGAAGSGASGSGASGSGAAGSGAAGSGSGAAGAGGAGSGVGQSGLIKFNGSAVIVPAALSHRYDRKAS